MTTTIDCKAPASPAVKSLVNGWGNEPSKTNAPINDSIASVKGAQYMSTARCYHCDYPATGKSHGMPLCDTHSMYTAAPAPVQQSRPGMGAVFDDETTPLVLPPPPDTARTARLERIADAAQMLMKAMQYHKAATAYYMTGYGFGGGGSSGTGTLGKPYYTCDDIDAVTALDDALTELERESEAA